ncbi:MAG: 2-dehydropantoate 2-reductase [Candidatus Atribacteria bacterium]|nr:2-dehydropantoate 2-reductase [Candidatus Atribacteria bacterium]
MPLKIKNICVFGMGGIGGYFGGRIAHKMNNDKLGGEIYFIARGEHLKAIQGQGLKLITDKEELLSFPNIATDKIKNIPTPDLYLLCVKGYDLKDAIIEIAKNITDNTIVVPLLNGVDIYERVRATLSKGIVIPAAVYVTSSIEVPGVVRQSGPEGRIVYGADPENQNYNYRYLEEFWVEMGINAVWFKNPYSAIWEKYVFIAAFSLMTAYSGKTIGGVMEDKNLRDLTENIMKEIVLIAKSRKVDLKKDIIEISLQTAGGFPYEAQTSFQRDYTEGKEKNEGEIFGGALVHMAADAEIDIPNITDIYGKLKL